MAKPRKGQKLVCVPCARAVVISNGGISRTTLWCCGKPMKSKSEIAKKAKASTKAKAPTKAKASTKAKAPMKAKASTKAKVSKKK